MKGTLNSLLQCNRDVANIGSTFVRYSDSITGSPSCVSVLCSKHRPNDVAKLLRCVSPSAFL